jgi:hypothetical protein
MADLQNTTTEGLVVSGQTTFDQMPSVNGSPIVKRQEAAGFFVGGTYYRADQSAANRRTNVFSQDPLSTTPQIVNMSGVIPSNLRGNIAYIDIWIEFLVSASAGDANRAIWMTKPRGSAGSGDAWTTYGYLFEGLTRQGNEFRIVTDVNGDFEIWSYSGVWQHRVAQIKLCGIGLIA